MRFWAREIILAAMPEDDPRPHAPLAFYIREGKRAVRCDDLLAYDRWRRRNDLTVARTDIFPRGLEGPRSTVSTVFLALDYQWRPGGPPLLFETTVHDEARYEWLPQYARRYTTWEEAEAGHTEVCAQIRRDRWGRT